MKGFALVVLFLSGCTTFAFTAGKAPAPDELKDRSTMIRVEGRAFPMGAQHADPDEYPEHSVEVSTFLLDKNEVRLGEYLRCVSGRVCRHAPALNEDVRASMTPDHPAVGVSWYDAKKYCEWIGKRLPTEAEWELAARAPRMGKFPFDGAFGPTVVNGRGAADGFDRTAPVGSFPLGVSGLGVMDMAGNAAEWTADWYDATFYPKSPVKNPTGPPVATGNKTYRGGGWTCPEYECRSTRRMGLDPNLSNDSVGFRCASENLR
jgi:formylglycine-generating enzyme required for sulfatase activity